MIYKIVIVDDHALVATAISELIDGIPNCDVFYHVRHGQELFDRFVHSKNIPDLVLLDINMPIMDGYETVAKLHKNFPEVRVLALSMNDSEESYMKMIELGANGFLSKSSKKSELELAINTVFKQGYYYTEQIANSLFKSIHNKNQKQKILLSDREKEVLSYIGTEMTYQQIAAKMFLSPSTVDGYRNSLFQKLDIKSRQGLTVYAIKEGLFIIE